MKLAQTMAGGAMLTLCFFSAIGVGGAAFRPMHGISGQRNMDGELRAEMVEEGRRLFLGHGARNREEVFSEVERMLSQKLVKGAFIGRDAVLAMLGGPDSIEPGKLTYLCAKGRTNVYQEFVVEFDDRFGGDGRVVSVHFGGMRLY